MQKDSFKSENRAQHTCTICEAVRRHEYAANLVAMFTFLGSLPADHISDMDILRY